MARGPALDRSEANRVRFRSLRRQDEVGVDDDNISDDNGTIGASHWWRKGLVKPKKRVTSGYHHGNLREALVDAAMDHLAAAGPSGVTIRGAAREAGVSHAAPYRHFRSKEALLSSVAEMGFRDLASRTEGARGAHPGDAGAALLAVAHAFLRFSFDHPALYRLMFGPQIREFSAHEGLRRAAERAFEVLVDLIADGQRDGAFIDGPARQHAAFAWSSLHGIASLRAEGRLGVTHRPALDQLGASVARLALRGLARES
jgi:AcrR family transcriptional regulator